MNKQYKVSIGVPIYGVEKYIERCARSLFEQSYDNIEYVFVDDHSSDNSLKILKEVIEEYPHRKSQVQIIQHNKNEGLASARNTFLDNATGDFVMHIDSDDWVERDIVKMSVEKQAYHNADIVTVAGNFIWRKSVNAECLIHYDSPSSLLRAILCSKSRPRIWGRLIRKSLYDNNSIKCEIGLNMGEDLLILPKLLYYANIVDYVDKPCYNYVMQAEGAYTSTFKVVNGISLLQVRDNLMDFFAEKESFYLRDLQSSIPFFYMSMIRNCARINDFGLFYQKIRKRADLIPYSEIRRVPSLYRLFLCVRNTKILHFYILLCDAIISSKRRLTGKF